MTVLPAAYSHPKSRPWVLALVVLLTLSLLAVPIVEKTPNALAFETFYNAGMHWLQGLNPYAAYEGFDYYKLSPTFLLPLIAFAQVPFVVSVMTLRQFVTRVKNAWKISQTKSSLSVIKMDGGGFVVMRTIKVFLLGIS
jgi:hypothetical protein